MSKFNLKNLFWSRKNKKKRKEEAEFFYVEPREEDDLEVDDGGYGGNPLFNPESVPRDVE